MRTKRSRSAFTLIELLTVMFIVSVLAAIAIPLVGDVMQATRKSATRATIAKIHESLQKKQDDFNREFPYWFRTRHGIDFQIANSQHLIIRMDKFYETFRTTSPVLSAADSAEMLYEVVMTHETDMLGPPAKVTFNASEIGDTDGDGRLEFVDSWGQPLRYYPSPTRLLRPGGYGTPVVQTTARILWKSLPTVGTTNQDDRSLPSHSRTLGIDQMDPLEIFSDPDASVLSGLMAPLTASTFEDRYHTLGTYHAPLVVSAGQDGIIGLHEPHDRTNHGHLAKPIPGETNALHDNLTNLNR